MIERLQIAEMRVDHIPEFGRMIAEMVAEAPRNFTITPEEALEYGSNQAFMVGMHKAITENKVGRFVVLDEFEELVGAVTTSIKDNSVRIGNMYVRPHARSMGAGAILLDACETRAVQDDIALTTLEVGSANGDARRFYEQQGYTPFDPPITHDWPMHQGLYGELLVKDLSEVICSSLA